MKINTKKYQNLKTPKESSNFTKYRRKISTNELLNPKNLTSGDKSPTLAALIYLRAKLYQGIRVRFNKIILN